MDESTKKFLEIIREEQQKDHQEVKRRLELIERNQQEFREKIVIREEVQSEIRLLHGRVSEAKEELEKKIEEEKKRVNELEKAKASLEGGHHSTKFWGCVVGGILLIVEIIVLIYK